MKAYRLSWVSLCVFLSMIGLFLFQERRSFYPINSSPKGTYSTKSTTTARRSIPPKTVQLLKDNPGSFWNCHLPETPCRYFEPYKFWQEDGMGGIFRDDYQRLGGSNNNLPAMTALSWSSPQEARVASYLPHNLSFIHIHKCAGTTVKTLLAQAKQKLRKKQSKVTTKVVSPVQATLLNYKYSFGGGSGAQKERNQQRRQQHIDEMVQALHKSGSSNNNAPSHAVVFTIVRDPIERFVSAVQQVMHYNDEFRAKCLKWTARATLKCAIQYIRETNYLRDVHLVPMVTHFRLWDLDPTTRMAVLELNDLPILAEYFLALDENNSNNNTTSMPHGRDRSQIQYATSKVLAHMSVKQHCTSDMIRELCQLYAVDVVFMKSLGYDSSYCSGID